MLRRMLLTAAIGACLCLAPATHPQAAAQDTKQDARAVTKGKSAARHARKRPRIVVRRSSGYGPYGFLPGYTPPDLTDLRPRKTYHYWRGYDWYGWPVGSWGTGGYGGMWYRGRFSNGFGPCWTRTPIGPMWNCG